MDTVQILFAKTPTIGSLAIRAVTWSRWSHVALMTQEATVIEASFPHGVREVALGEFFERCSVVEAAEVWCPSPDMAIDFARSQVGKPYDTWGALGLGLHREWADPAAWWCSELVEAALAAGGHQRFRHDMQRVTPQHSWMVSPNGTTC